MANSCLTRLTITIILRAMGLSRNRSHLSIVATNGASQVPEGRASAFDNFRTQQQAALLTSLVEMEIDLEDFPHVVPAGDPVHGLLESIYASGKIEPEPLDKVTIVIDPTDRHSAKVSAAALHIDLPSRGGPEQFLGTLAVIRLSQPQGDLVALFAIPDPDAERQVTAARFFRQTSAEAYEAIPEDEVYFWHEGEDSKPEDFLRNAMRVGACSTDTITATKVSFLSAEDFGSGPDGDGGIPAPLPFRRAA